MKRVKVVGAVIQNEMNQILCALRSPLMTLPNYWEFPGGKIEEGETCEAALIREIQEELNCKIEVKDKIIEVDHSYERVIVNLHTYWATIVKGEPAAREHTSLQWVNIEELPHLNWALADIPTVEEIMNQVED